MEAVKTLVAVDREWVPDQPGTSLYIRPFIIATDASLGVHASHTYLFCIITGPVGAYYAEGINPVRIYVEDDDVRAVPCGKTVEAIVDTAQTYLADAFAQAHSFKVESKRADKSFPMSSIQLSQWVGGELHEAYPHLKVDVHHPELTVYVEVREDAAYVHAPAEPAAGGLPIGMGGRAVSLLSGGIDSPVASYMMAKRGV